MYTVISQILRSFISTNKTAIDELSNETCVCATSVQTSHYSCHSNTHDTTPETTQSRLTEREKKQAVLPIAVFGTDLVSTMCVVFGEYNVFCFWWVQYVLFWWVQCVLFCWVQCVLFSVVPNGDVPWNCCVCLNLLQSMCHYFSR
jgi:hypothetical protein